MNDIKIILTIIVVVQVTVSAILVTVVMVIIKTGVVMAVTVLKGELLLSYHSEDLPEAKIQLEKAIDRPYPFCKGELLR